MRDPKRDLGHGLWSFSRRVALHCGRCPCPGAAKSAGERLYGLGQPSPSRGKHQLGPPHCEKTRNVCRPWNRWHKPRWPAPALVKSLVIVSWLKHPRRIFCWALVRSSRPERDKTWRCFGSSTAGLGYWTWATKRTGPALNASAVRWLSPKIYSWVVCVAVISFGCVVRMGWFGWRCPSPSGSWKTQMKRWTLKLCHFAVSAFWSFTVEGSFTKVFWSNCLAFFQMCEWWRCACSRNPWMFWLFSLGQLPFSTKRHDSVSRFAWLDLRVPRLAVSWHQWQWQNRRWWAHLNQALPDCLGNLSELLHLNVVAATWQDRPHCLAASGICRSYVFLRRLRMEDSVTRKGTAHRLGCRTATWQPYWKVNIFPILYII